MQYHTMPQHYSTSAGVRCLWDLLPFWKLKYVVPSGYTVYYADRSHHGSGLLIAIVNTLQSTIRHFDLEKLEVELLWIQLPYN